MEEWRDIRGYEGKYQVSNEGRVKSLDYHRKGIEQTLKPMTTSRGYKRVALMDGHGIAKMEFVHRLVAKAFIPNPNNYPIINHKDENPSNNFVFVNEDGSIDYEKSNIEWCTPKYNNTYNDRHLKAAPKISKSKLGLKASDEAKKHMSESQKKRYENGETSWNKGKPSWNRKPVIKYDIKSDEELEFFEYVGEASEKTKCDIGHIIDCCKGRRKCCGGFGWKYA